MIRRDLGGATAVFTDRHGGRSAAPFDSLNLARHVGDDPLDVVANHRAAACLLGGPEAPWILPRHVHGTEVHVAMDETVDGADGDGVATNLRGLLLVAIGADCAPIAIANDTAGAAVHAGWRGAVNGVIERGVAAVRALGSGPVHAIVGPCVCVAHYEFGADLLEELVSRIGPEVRGETAAGEPAFDLRAAITIRLRAAGVDDIEVLDVCTVESADHFSYRRDGVTGRHGVVVSMQ